MTDELGIGDAFCNCPEQEMCYHIGALALNTGYETPIFSYHSATNSESDDSSESAAHPIQEVYVKMEMFEPTKTEPIDSLNEPTGEALKVRLFEHTGEACTNVTTLYSLFHLTFVKILLFSLLLNSYT